MTVVPLTPYTIGGSEAAAACGVDPWCSRIELYLRKRGEWPNELSEAAAWGTWLEPVIFEYLLNTGHDVQPGLGIEFRNENGHPWMVGHPDGWATIEGEPGLLEIKTAGANTAHDWRGAFGAPRQYLAQLHHYFYITGYSVALLAVLIGGQRLETRIVHRDEAVIERMLNLEGDFIGRLERGEMPRPDGSRSSAEALRELFAGSGGMVARADKDIERHVREARILDAQIKERKAQLDKHKQVIEAYMGDAHHLVSKHDTPLCDWTVEEYSVFDKKALPAELVERHTEKRQRRRLIWK